MKKPLEIIKYEPPTLKCQKVIEVICGQIELYEHRVKCNYHIYVEEPKDCDDTSMPWEEKEINFTSVFLRKQIAGCLKEWRCKSELWEVLISVNGMADIAYFYFKTEKEADELIETIMNYVESV